MSPDKQSQEPDSVKARSPVDESPDRPDSAQQQPDAQQLEGGESESRDNGPFSHSGARIISQQAADGDGPYLCRKCGDAVLTVSVTMCPACLDVSPWFPPAEEEEEPCPQLESSE